MLIELIGPAGIGKTTAARRLATILEGNGLDVLGFDELERLEQEIGMRSFRGLGPSRRAFVIAGLVLRRSDIVLPVMLLAWLSGPERSTGSRRARWRRARRLLGHVRLVLALRSDGRTRAQDDRIVLLHDGFTQLLWTLLIDGPPLRAERLIRFVLARYHAVTGQRCIRFVADDETVVDRVFSRDVKSRFSRNSDERQRRDFEHWLDVHRGLVDLLPKGLVIETVDGSSTPEEVVTTLANAVSSMLPTPLQEDAGSTPALSVRSLA